MIPTDCPLPKTNFFALEASPFGSISINIVLAKPFSDDCIPDFYQFQSRSWSVFISQAIFTQNISLFRGITSNIGDVGKNWSEL